MGRMNLPSVALNGVTAIAGMFDHTKRDQQAEGPEKAVLVSVNLPNRPWISQDPLDEIRGLATSAGATVVGQLTQKKQSVEPATYIGKGKLGELKQLAQASGADVIFFDNDLSPAQIRNLEKATEVKVLDRSELILDIFATRARSHEAKLQVELAQLEYSLPRLKQMWSHLGPRCRWYRHSRAG